MLINRYHFELACAAMCINPAEAVQRAGLPPETEEKIMKFQELPPAEVGKLAAALQVAPADIADPGLIDP